MAILWLFFSVFAAADCNSLRIQHLNNIQLNPSNKTYTQSFTISSNKGACDFIVTINNGSADNAAHRSINNGSRSIPIQICTDSGCTFNWKSLEEYNVNSEVFNGSLSGSNKNIDFTFYITQNSIDTYQSFGTYGDTFSVKLYSVKSNGRKDLEDTRSISIREQINKKIDLSLVNPGMPFDASSTFKLLDFGTLKESKFESFDLVLKYNAGYKISVASENAGKLQCTACTSTIDYRFILGSQEIALSKTPQWVNTGTGTSPIGGLRFSSKIVIGSTSNAGAGQYSDSITITVATTE